MVSKAYVEHIAILACLELDEEEKEKYTAHLSEILGFVQKLNKLDIRKVLPTTQVFPLKNVFREDKAGAHLGREKVFANAPEEKDGHFKVPSIL